jgi:hypothetical protein
LSRPRLGARILSEYDDAESAAMIRGYADRFSAQNLSEAERREILAKFGAQRSSSVEEMFGTLTFHNAARAASWATSLTRIMRVVEVGGRDGVEFVSQIALQPVADATAALQALKGMPVQNLIDAGRLAAEVETAEEIRNLVAWCKVNR